MQRLRTRSRCAKAAVILSIVCLAGCGRNGLVSVSGKVSNAGNTLTTGTVTFHPDEEKGNKSKKILPGRIESDGAYTIYTNQTEGAEPGWYKVTVVATEPTPKEAQGMAQYARPKYVVAPAYIVKETTPISIEVKHDAPDGHYDLKLKSWQKFTTN